MFPIAAPTTRIALGVGLLLAGAATYRYAYQLTLLGEWIDAIGSTTSGSSVEPADWNVRLRKYIGITLVLFGVGVATTGVLYYWP